MSGRHSLPLRGFTLIELLVTIVMIAVLSVIAAPSYLTFQRNSELRASANNFLGTIVMARSEAMKRQQNVYVIPLDGSNWSSGWVAFVDVNRNVVAGAVTMESGTDIELARQGPMPSGIVAVSSTDATGFADGSDRYVMFNGNGFMMLLGGGFPSGGGAALDVTSTASGESRRIIANSTGRARVCKPGEAGCTASTL